jgi:hypothetical protein
MGLGSPLKPREALLTGSPALLVPSHGPPRPSGDRAIRTGPTRPQPRAVLPSPNAQGRRARASRPQSARSRPRAGSGAPNGGPFPGRASAPAFAGRSQRAERPRTAGNRRRARAQATRAALGSAGSGGPRRGFWRFGRFGRRFPASLFFAARREPLRERKGSGGSMAHPRVADARAPGRRRSTAGTGQPRRISERWPSAASR